MQHHHRHLDKAVAQVLRRNREQDGGEQEHLGRGDQLLFTEQIGRSFEWAQATQVRHQGFKATDPATADDGTQDGRGHDNRSEGDTARQANRSGITKTGHHAGRLPYYGGIKSELLAQGVFEAVKENRCQQQNCERTGA